MMTLAASGSIFAAFYVYTRYAGFIQNIGEFAFYIGTGCMFPVVLLPFCHEPDRPRLPSDLGAGRAAVPVDPRLPRVRLGVLGGPRGGGRHDAVYLRVAGLVFRRVERHVLEVGNLSEY